MEITLSIAKKEAYNEVARLTAYIGSKAILEGGGNSYEQVFTTDDDNEMLEKYWREASNATTGNLRRFIKSVSPTQVDINETLKIILTKPNRYDDNQTEAIQTALFDYFVNFIAGKWLTLAFKAEAEYYEKCSVANMSEVLLKLFHKTKPKRPL